MEADAPPTRSSARCDVRGGEVDAEIFRTGLCLPSGSGLTEAQRTTVIEAVAKAPSALDGSGRDR